MDRGKRSPGIRRRGGAPADRQLRARGHAGAIPQRLPLVHVTAVGIAKEIVRSRKLETRQCPVFKRKLLYFFALRAAYRLRDGDAKSHQINRFPFIFVVSPDAVANPFHVYPFDTGGAVGGVFSEQADPHVFLEDYELAPEHGAVARQIGWAFGTLQAYFDGEIRGDILDGIPPHETVTRGFVDIARLARSGSNQPDKRASAIEVALSHDVDLKGNVMLAIIPKQYLEEDGTSPNVEFMDRLKAEGISWEVYDWQPNTAPNELQDEIARIARTWFRKNGFL